MRRFTLPWSRKYDIDQFLLTLLVASLPFERIPSVDAAGITVRASLVIGGIVILRALYKLGSERKLPHLSWAERLIAAFAVWIIILVPTALNHSRALEVVAFNLFALAMAMAVRLLFKRKYLLGITRALLYVSIAVCIFGLYQYFGDIAGLKDNLTGLRPRYSWAVFGFPRIQGASLEPLYFASLLMLPAALTCALILSYGWRKLYVVALALASLDIFLTVSRGGTFAFVLLLASLLGYALIKRHFRRAMGIVLVVVAMYALALLMIAKLNKPIEFGPSHQKTSISTYTKQISDTGLGGGGDERAQSRALALSIFKSHPLVGIGPGNYGPYVQHNMKPASGWVIVNNETLELLAETGIVGLSLIVLAFSMMLFAAAKTVKNETNILTSAWLVGLSGFLIATAIQFQTFSTLYIIHIWVGVGILLGLVATSTRKTSRA